MVASQLIAHLSTPFDQFKFECRCKHLTEIALTRAVNDLLIAMDFHLTICPVFDTEDHQVPFDLLEGWYLFTLTALSVMCGIVLYWSILGLNVVSHRDLYLTCLCSVYVLPLGHIFNKLDIHFQLCRWHSNLYLTVKTFRKKGFWKNL